ncbi:MAG TPA: PAS domain-containing protein [Myxococcaceae bacterium]|nr:PAS domain-containing protein [Myxococcaceae bacterium]
MSLLPRSTLVTGVLPRVWLVDDSPLEIEHTRGILSRAYQVETFTDGASVLERLAQPGVELPELLLLDWLMPGVTGLEACHFLREHYGPTDLPILVLTASTHEGALEEAFAAGANDYVAKPARAVELLARVRALVQTRHDARALRERERERSLLLTEVEAERTRLTTILSTLEEGVMLHDVQGVVRFSNAAAKRLLGRTSEQMAGRPPTDPGWGAVREDGSPLPAEERAPMLALRTGQSVRGVIIGVRHSDGRLVWLSCNAQPYFGQDGETLAGVVASFFDVTAERAASAERERLLGEVEAARVRLETLFENAPAAICILRGPEHVFELINPAYQRLVGLGRPLVDRPLREALPELVEQGFLGLLDDVYRGGKPFFGNEVPIRLDRRGEGTLEDAFIYQLYQPVRDASGQIVGIDVFGFDVTEQVRTRHRLEALAQRLRESEEHLLRVAQASGTGIWEMDTATETLVTDARFRELFGLAPDEQFPLEKGLSLIHPEDQPRVNSALRAALAGDNGGRYQAEYRTVRNSEGRWRWVEARGQAEFGPDGKPVRILGTGVDITARKQVEAEREGLLEALAAQPSLNVCVLRGPRVVFEMANAVYLRQIAGGRDIIGKPLSEALPELLGQGFDTHFERLLATGQPYVGLEVPTHFYRADGTRAEGFYNFVHQPIRSRDGVYDSILCIGQDVTDIVRARKEAERLMALEKERASFEQQLIGIVSHDLRNPVAAIMMGASILLRRPDVEERQRRTAERILVSAGRANRLIHDLLDFTQARLGGGLRVKRVPSDFHAILRQVVEESQVSNPGRVLSLVQQGSGEGAWDEDRLAQVVSNLLANAVHYSPPDSAVSIEMRGEPNELVLAVHNSGAPIPPEVLPHLFQPMQRGVAEVSEARSVGLGLYIVDQVVRAHRGSVEVASTSEAGTTFTVRLPRAH